MNVNYWKVKSHIHAKGEAHARMQQAVQIARTMEASFMTATAELVKVMTAAGLKPELEYRFDDEAETITPARPEQKETTS